MTERLAPGVVTVVVVTFFVLAMAVPFIVMQARSTRDALRSAGIVAALLSYAAAVVAYTVLPLPSARAMAQRCAIGEGGAAAQLVPFHFLTQVGAGRTGGWAVLGDPALWQVALNVALFVPLGFLLRRTVHAGLWGVITVACAASLGIELTQGTGLWFVYDCAYRVLDVDDVLANTLGALAGAAFAGPSGADPPVRD